MAKLALERMARHEGLTGIHHDPVMVFPQGVFSQAAMSVLQHAGFIAVVNNDVISSDPDSPPVRIADLWDVAVMRYGGFPLFTRRYPWEGIENFAFDAVLGKPCLPVIHHDFCQNDCQGLIEFVERLNALRQPLTWRGLGEVARGASRQRELSPDAVQVEMYSTELRLENRSGRKRYFMVERRQADPALIQNIQLESKPVEWSAGAGRIRVELELQPATSATVRLRSCDLAMDEPAPDSLRLRLGTSLRRYFCEARDNYCLRYGGSLASRLFQVN
jgi:hypothetical protein